jgi:hypothetical protein
MSIFLVYELDCPVQIFNKRPADQGQHRKDPEREVTRAFTRESREPDVRDQKSDVRKFRVS